MDEFTAVGICEGWIPASEERQSDAWQLLVDTGVVWTLQGWFGRTATYLIEHNIVHT